MTTTMALVENEASSKVLVCWVPGAICGKRSAACRGRGQPWWLRV